MNGDDLKIHREYFPSELLKTEWYEKNGKSEGWRRLWFDNGQIFTEAEFYSGRANGWIREWTEDGILVLEARTIDGDFHGSYRSWWDDGIRKEDGTYRHGKRTTGYRWYKTNGELWKERKDDQSRPDDLPPAWSVKDIE